MTTRTSPIRAHSVRALSWALLAASGGSLACGDKQSRSSGIGRNNASDDPAPIDASGADGPACDGQGPWSEAPSWEYCAGDFVHRPMARGCAITPHATATPLAPTFTGADAGFTEVDASAAPAAVGEHRLADTDCADADAFCVSHGDVPSVCVKSCREDADCGAQQLCLCRVKGNPPDEVSFGTCHTATCSADSECEEGLLCVGVIPFGDCSLVPRDFNCQSPADECAKTADSACGGNACQFIDDHYQCLGGSDCGRPFLVDGTARTAQAVDRHDWVVAEVANACPEHLPADTRAVLAAHYLRLALLEHASIAAFARFQLQLLALGAPPDLVADTASAMADETRHARLCFSLAQRYDSNAKGAGELNLDNALPALDLLEVAELVIVEGCIGESVAALQARWAALASTDCVVRTTLDAIADDEARHAALAVRFVTWAAQRDARVSQRFADLIGEARAAMAPHSSPSATRAESAFTTALGAHGVLEPACQLEARRAVLFEILPKLLLSVTQARGVNTRGASCVQLTRRPRAQRARSARARPIQDARRAALRTPQDR